MVDRIRRIVTGHDVQGRAIIVSDQAAPRHITFDSLTGLEFIELWSTQSIPQIPVSPGDPTEVITSFVPTAGGSRFRIVRFPSSLESTSVDPVAFHAEFQHKIPGLSAAHEVDNLGMHTTNTIDYGIVLWGEINLELDDQTEIHLKAGDCIIQNGTRHAWRNRGAEACMIAFIMIGATQNNL
jgi:hypothetical protein